MRKLSALIKHGLLIRNRINLSGQAMNFFLSIVLLLGLTSCMLPGEELAKIGKEPEMDSMQLPPVHPAYKPVVWPQQFVRENADSYQQKSYANSLWDPGARTFFKAHKANRVGDIMKVSIEISDKAELDNATNSSRTNTEDTQAPTLLGLQDKLKYLIPGAKLDPTDLINISAANNHSGQGSVEREERINTEVAAMVTQILPNGNLVIHADQEVRVNHEIRKVTVDGIVRPEDIESDNSIASDLIAQARISYGGRGQISKVQQARYGTQILDIISPF